MLRTLPLFLILFICDGFYFPKPSKFKFFKGAYEPVENNRNAICEVISGEIPFELLGKTCARIGPNPQYNDECSTILDASGMIHSINIDDNGKIIYNNNFVETDRYIAEKRNGGPLFFRIGDFNKPFAMIKCVLLEFCSKFEIIPNIPLIRMSPANTNIVQNGKDILALCESGLPYSLKYEKTGFKTNGVENYDSFLHTGFTAHPKKDPRTGYMYGFGTKNEIITVYVFDEKGSPKRKFDIPLKSKTIMHDFSITKNNILILDMPLIVKHKLLFKGKMPVEFDKNRKSRIGIIPIDSVDGSSIEWYDLEESFAISHVINSWENSSDGSIHLVTCDLDDVFLNPKELCNNVSEVYKTVIDVKNKSIYRKKLIDYSTSIDFPVIRRYLHGVMNRYAYMTELVHGKPRNIIKIDLHSGDILASTNVSEYSGECFFIEKDGVEDDGYIASFLTKGMESTFCIWDAKDLSESCRIKIPYRIPLGFHTLVF